MDNAPSGISTGAAYAIVLYALLVVALPFVADTDIPWVIYLMLWLGGPCAAGVFAPWPPLVGITLVAVVVFTAVLFTGAVDTEFFMDPLSIIALVVLTGGELMSLGLGSALRVRRLAA